MMYTDAVIVGNGRATGRISGNQHTGGQGISVFWVVLYRFRALASIERAGSRRAERCRVEVRARSSPLLLLSKSNHKSGDMLADDA